MSDAGRMTFSHEITVRFGDVDHARVVYLPRYFHYCHRAFEEWFGQAVGVPYPEVVGAMNVGFPTVDAHARFRAPLRYGDRVRVHVLLERVGNRSMTCAYRLERLDGTPAAEIRLTTACVDNASFRAVEIPPRIRQRLAALERRAAAANEGGGAS